MCFTFHFLWVTSATVPPYRCELEMTDWFTNTCWQWGLGGLATLSWVLCETPVSLWTSGRCLTSFILAYITCRGSWSMIFSWAANTIYCVTTPVRIESRLYMRMAIRNQKYVPGQSSTTAMLKQHWQVGSAWKAPPSGACSASPLNLKHPTHIKPNKQQPRQMETREIHIIT